MTLKEAKAKGALYQSGVDIFKVPEAPKETAVATNAEPNEINIGGEAAKK